jgi:hypothetical protein
MFKLDSNDAHKGSMLYATPDHLQFEHFVFAISPRKGVTISYTRFLISNYAYNALPFTVTAEKMKLNAFENLMSKIPNVIFTNIIRKSKCPGTGLFKEFTNCSHIYSIARLKLVNDIEKNPGPTVAVPLTVVTLNCRGLGKIEKARLTLNKINALHKSGDIIAMLQETMITTDNYIKLAWRGKYVITPGTGNSKGCLTLFRHNVEILSVEHIEHRGHLIKIKGLEGHDREVLIINIYAPNGFALDKSEYFNNIFQHISEWDGDIIMGGDFNLTFSDRDRFKRGVTPAENRLATTVTELINEYGLIDAWGGKKGYTWRKRKIMSKLDRVLFRSDDYELHNNTVDWTLTTSDHAAVITSLKHIRKLRQRNEHIKLDNEIIKNIAIHKEIEQYLIEQLATATQMNPHVKLDFAKMTLRTKTLEIMKRQKDNVANELKELNAEIQQNILLLTRHYDNHSQQILVNDIEELTRKKDCLLQKQGTKLATFAKSKWFNEGEKSNKYFLNLLKRTGSRNEMTKLIDAGRDITNESEIRKVVGTFYNNLYNSNESVEHDPTLLQNMFTVAPEDNVSISQPITLDELWRNLKNTKATTPGPDGLSNTYLKKFWHVLGPLIVEAWNYSMRNDELPPSHKQSLLRLIPKAGKDTAYIKNWRPITLSNCDHKLITRTYNVRLLNVISQHITTTQTAYIKGRNIADNLRLLGAAVRLADFQENIDATAIALDAQKAFDSVSHEYISNILEHCGLTNFIPIFKLLYKDLHNDIIINGKIGKGYKIGNGVKQGDALSCSLFLLAIEPVIRNITLNQDVVSLHSDKINFTWPKVIAYADDITVLTQNSEASVCGIFKEYEKLTKASGLKLNADKTEKFNITSRNVQGALRQNNINYNNTQYILNNLDTIKINGIWFNTDVNITRQLNYEHMMGKMNRHFKAWSKRGLSLLGKNQIIKTFGMSQYLYTLAVLDLGNDHWKQINKTFYKFLWNKNYDAAPAPHRIKKEIMMTSVDKGGFGIADLKTTIKASRLRRFNYLMVHNTHPITELQTKLGGKEYMCSKPLVNIDDITTNVMKDLAQHYNYALNTINGDLVGIDVELNRILLNSKLINIVNPRHKRCRLMTTFRRRGIITISDAITANDDSFDLLLTIINPNLTRHVIEIRASGLDSTILGPSDVRYVYCHERLSSVNMLSLTSKQIRLVTNPTRHLNRTKLLDVTEEQAVTFYHKIKLISSVQNRTKMLRLIHGDVYCGSRLKKFKLTDNDRCIRCFEEETILHLLIMCPYTKQVWNTLGKNPTCLRDILNELSLPELEITAELLSELVFRKKVLPPHILLKNIYKAFADGVCWRRSVTRLATNMVNSFNAG